MKNFISAVAVVALFAGVALADGFPVVIANQVLTTNTATYGTVQGKINTIVIDVTGTTTQTVTITSERTGEAILTETVSVDTVRRVRMPLHGVTGVAIAGVSNQVDKFYLSNDTLTFTVAETAPVTNSTTITVIIE